MEAIRVFLMSSVIVILMFCIATVISCCQVSDTDAEISKEENKDETLD